MSMPASDQVVWYQVSTGQHQGDLHLISHFWQHAAFLVVHIIHQSARTNTTKAMIIFPPAVMWYNKDRDVMAAAQRFTEIYIHVDYQCDLFVCDLQ